MSQLDKDISYHPVFADAVERLRAAIARARDWGRMSEEITHGGWGVEIGGWINPGKDDENGIVFVVYRSTWDYKVDEERVVRLTRGVLPIKSGMHSAGRAIDLGKADGA